MSWYRTGTVTVTNGSTTVTGSGTAWVANSRVGDAFVGPDGLTYEITNIASNTAISVLPAYRSASGSGLSYSIIPVQGYTKTLADQASDLVNSYDKPWNVADNAADARTALEIGSSAEAKIAFSLGDAAFLNAAGNIGDLSKILKSIPFIPGDSLDSIDNSVPVGAYRFTPSTIGNPTAFYGTVIWNRRADLGGDSQILLFEHTSGMRVAYRCRNITEWYPTSFLLDTLNTTVDSNGFIKQASPIVKLFSNKVEFNSESVQQEISLVVNGIGDYTVIGTTGFAQDGWYIETPKDSNGNIKCFVEYEQIAQSDGTYIINVKTFEPDYSEGPAKAGVQKHIPEGRWIDIRLQPLPASE